MPLRAVIYARYSSELQREASIDDQIRTCQDLIAAEGWELCGVFTDAAMSGASKFRPEYQALLAGVRRRDFDVVVAEGLDRLSRDSEDTAALVKALKFAGVKLITKSEGEVDALRAGFKGTMNALFLADLAIKTHRGLQGRVVAGQSAGGLSFGYNVVREVNGRGEPLRGGLQINPQDANTVRRIFDMFAGGQSPIAIAHMLNAEAVPGPNGKAWRDTTIRGHGPRGTGILRNRLYIGQRVWNRMHFMKDPATGKRVSRMNPADKWQFAEVPDLRIVEQDLWERVQARLAGIRTKSGADKPGRPRFWDHRRPQHLLTGKLTCGVCGGVIGNVGKDYLSCTTARRQGLCSNKASIRRSQMEALILDTLRTQLMAPELVAEFCAEFTAEWNRLAGERSALRGGAERELTTVVRKLDSLIEAISEGMRGAHLQAQMDKLEARKAALEMEIAAPAETSVRLHPALGEVYRARVAGLTEALRRDDHAEALELARGLIERVTLKPLPEGGFEIDLEGAIAAMVQLGLGPDAKSRPRNGGAGDDQFWCSVKVVAGTCIGRDRHLLAVAI